MFKSLTRYVIVGLANTVLTAVIILSLTSYGLGVYSANATGYIAGFLLSFILNSCFTFTVRMTPYSFIKFVLACGICYLMNVAIIKIYLEHFNGGKYTAQILGMFFYTTLGFTLNKLWVMK